MRNVVLTIMVAASIAFTSCKESTKNDVNKEITEIGNEIEDGLDEAGKTIKEGYKNAKESVQSAFSDIDIPDLNNEKAEMHLKEYANYVKTQMDKGAENIKNSEFAKETKEFGQKSEMFMKNLGADAKASFKATMAKIDAKADEIEKDLED